MKFINGKELISRVYRNLNLKDEERFGDMVEWMHECMQLIGVSKQYEQKIAQLNVEACKGKLPCDFHELIMVMKKETLSYINHEVPGLETLL